jgi:hypothetical protein
MAVDRPDLRTLMDRFNLLAMISSTIVAMLPQWTFVDCDLLTCAIWQLESSSTWMGLDKTWNDSGPRLR